MTNAAISYRCLRKARSLMRLLFCVQTQVIAQACSSAHGNSCLISTCPYSSTYKPMSQIYCIRSVHHTKLQLHHQHRQNATHQCRDRQAESHSRHHDLWVIPYSSKLLSERATNISPDLTSLLVLASLLLTNTSRVWTTSSPVATMKLTRHESMSVASKKHGPVMQAGKIEV